MVSHTSNVDSRPTRPRSGVQLPASRLALDWCSARPAARSRSAPGCRRCSRCPRASRTAARALECASHASLVARCQHDLCGKPSLDTSLEPHVECDMYTGRPWTVDPAIKSAGRGASAMPLQLHGSTKQYVCMQKFGRKTGDSVHSAFAPCSQSPHVAPSSALYCAHAATTRRVRDDSIMGAWRLGARVDWLAGCAPFPRRCAARRACSPDERAQADQRCPRTGTSVSLCRARAQSTWL